MAKRFVDTDLFKKRFVKGLQAPYKLLWIYILNDCNHAGIYEVEIEIAALRIGCPEITERSAIEFFGEKIVVFDQGTKWFIPSFIEFQYGQLSENNRAHSGVISLLSKYNLIDNFLNIKPLTSPLHGAMDMDKDKEEELDREKVKEKGEILEREGIIYPYETETFKANWMAWRTMLRDKHDKDYFNREAEQVALMHLSKISKSEDHAIQTIQKALRNGWADLYTLKIENNGNQNNGLNHSELDELIARETEKLRSNPGVKI